MTTPRTTLRQFWREARLLPRLAIVVAAIALAANVGSYAGLSMRGQYSWLGAVHGIIMLLGLITFLRVGLHHLLAIRALRTRVSSAPLPKHALLLTMGALLYVLGVIAWLYFTYGEGGPELRDGQEVWVKHGRVVRALPPGTIAEFATHELRLFSASWLFFALALAWTGHVVESRIHAYRMLRTKATA